jgi:phenazine biosynthesis protein PhzF family
MKIPIYQVDAFTSTLFEGNPAAVCPLRNWIDKNIMQKIAQENNLSETAFFVKKDNMFEIRWFTPVAELDLAGHPTLATTHVILKELKINLEKVVFKTNINDTLNVVYKDNLYLMDFPSRDP